MPSQTLTKRQTTQDSILSAAFTLFAQKGFGATTTKEIAESAQVNELTLFRHFQNKYNLLTQALGHALAKIRLERLYSNLASSDFESGLHQFARDLMHEMEAFSPMIRLMLIEATSNPELKSAVAPIVIKLRSGLLNHLERGQKEGLVRTDLNLDLVAQSFLWIFVSYAINRSDIGPQFCPFSPEEVAEASTRIFLRGLRPDSQDGH